MRSESALKPSDPPAVLYAGAHTPMARLGLRRSYQAHARPPSLVLCESEGRLGGDRPSLDPLESTKWGVRPFVFDADGLPSSVVILCGELRSSEEFPRPLIHLGSNNGLCIRRAGRLGEETDRLPHTSGRSQPRRVDVTVMGTPGDITCKDHFELK